MVSTDFCILTVQTIKDNLDKSIDDIIVAMEELNSFFKDGSHPIPDFTEKYLPQIIHYLGENLTVEEVCANLGYAK